MQRITSILMMVGLSALSMMPAGAAAPLPFSSHYFIGDLAAGDAIYAQGGYVADGRAQSHNVAYYEARVSDPSSKPPDPCAVPSSISNCFRYDFQVTEPGELRVAVDASNRGDCFGFELSDPTGYSRTFPTSCPVLGGSATDDGTGLRAFHAYTIERVLELSSQDVGVWQLRVVAGDVSDWAFRVRAGLDVGEDEPDVLTPNLRPWLPSEFGFAAPASPTSGYAMDHENPAGPGLESCTSSEEHEHCLRFSSGLTNIGNGPLFISFDTESNTGTQYVFRRDETRGFYTDNLENGAYDTYDAGTAGFHEFHGHRHINDMVLYELFEVTDTQRGKMDPKGKHLMEATNGEKEGYCSIDHGFGDWMSFYQDGWLSAHKQLIGDCAGALALSTGWGDMYRWQRQGQYVPYDQVAEPDGTMRPGLYVVRVTIDPEGRVVETNEKDNVGYALIEVVEDGGRTQVTICERGIGPHPWSPHARAQAEPFWWTILRSSQAPRPGECV